MILKTLPDYILSLNCNPVAFQKYVTAYSKLLEIDLHIDHFVGKNPLYKDFEIALEHSTSQTTIVKKGNISLCWSNNSYSFEHGHYTIADLYYYNLEINEDAALVLSPIDESESIYLSDIKQYALPIDCEDKLELFTKYSLNYLSPDIPVDVFEYEYLMNLDGEIKIEDTWIPVKTGNFKSKQQLEDYIKDGRVRKIQY